MRSKRTRIQRSPQRSRPHLPDADGLSRDLRTRGKPAGAADGVNHGLSLAKCWTRLHDHATRARVCTECILAWTGCLHTDRGRHESSHPLVYAVLTLPAAPHAAILAHGDGISHRERVRG